jgi:dipeptidyl aminopeptidase/acylaminoacyl peptidase
MNITRLIPLLLVCALFTCASADNTKKSLGYEPYSGNIQPGKWLKGLVVDYLADGVKKSAKVQIYFPRGYEKGKTKRALIGLHNYKGSMNEWETKSPMASYADKYGFIIVCPNMGKTIYETKYYPETTRIWDGIPGGRWVAEVLVKYLREAFDIAVDREKTGIFGNSTGARGAVLIACHNPGMFGAVVGLSGDYDPLSMTEDKFLASVYGKYKDFKERWENDDNIIKLAVNLKGVPLMIAHGEKDGEVPYDQSRLLAIRLLQLMNADKSYIKPEYHLKRWKFHNWDFWKFMVPDMLEFFDRNLKK